MFGPRVTKAIKKLASVQVSVVFAMLFVVGVVKAGDPKVMLNKACPDTWTVTDKTIPVVTSTDVPWQDTSDRSTAKSHLSSVDFTLTIDAVPVTNDDLADDPLTVASECLVYRNMLANGEQYYPPSPTVERDYSIGFISVSAF